MTKPTKYEVYDVHAIIAPTGKAMASNILVHRVFSTIYNHYEHEYVRWVVMSKHGGTVVRVADLWATDTIDVFPYVKPLFLDETFATADQAVAFVALTMID